MSTFTPNPAHYTLQDTPKAGPSCPQCALYNHDTAQCDGGPQAWVDQCLAPTSLRKVWVLRPEIAAQ